jgi:tetratricopeptide (TPR) repeat protein
MVTGGLVGRDWHPAFRSGGAGVRVWTFLGVVPEYFRLLLFPAHLSADYNPQQIPVGVGPGPRQLLGIVLLLFLFAAIVWSWRRLPVFAFGILWGAVALVPVSNLLLPTGIFLAERTLFLPSVGVALALGAALAPWLVQMPTWSPRLRRLVLAGGSLVALAGIVRSAVRQSVWKDNATLFSRTAEDAPLSYRARAARAVLWLENGREAEGEKEYLAALALYRDDPNLFSDLGNYYVRQARYAEALPMYQRVLELVPDHWAATSRSILCLIQLGRLIEARQLAQVATRRGDEGAAGKLAYVDSLLAHQSAPKSN